MGVLIFKNYNRNTGKDELLAIMPGQTVERFYGGETDEGYDYVEETFRFDGEILTCTSERSARDCDGTLHHETRYQAPAAFDPAWQEA